MFEAIFGSKKLKTSAADQSRPTCLSTRSLSPACSHEQMDKFLIDQSEHMLYLSNDISVCPRGKRKPRDRLYAAFHLFFILSLFLVVLEVHTIIAVLQLVLGYPLATITVSSLRSYTSYPGVFTSEINLKPFIHSLGASGPGPYFWSSCLKVQSSLYGGIIYTPLRRSTNLRVRYATIFHPKRPLTFCRFHRIETNTLLK